MRLGFREIVVTAIFVACNLAFAASDSVELMTVRKHSAPNETENTYSMECYIYSDSVHIRIMIGESSETSFKSSETVYTDKVHNAREVQTLIEAATRGTLSAVSSQADQPTSTFVGILEGDVVSRQVKLMRIAGGRTLTNSAEGTAALVEFGNANCRVPRGFL